ncbi:MAG: hypothetical protein WDM80_08885 [Limisphaerales bacterium]
MLIDYGNKVISKDKNIWSLIQIEKIIIRNQPDALVLRYVNGKSSHRAPRIRELHRKVAILVKKHKLKVVKISGTELRSALLGDEKGTKQEMAELLALQFPDELGSRLPPKRKPWKIR